MTLPAFAPSPASLLLASSERGFWMPIRGSTVAPGVDLIFDVITWISIFFFILIVVLMVIFVVKYRRQSADHSASVDAATHHTPLELTWTIIPLILVIVIFYIGMQGYINIRNAPPGAYEINVTAQKWSWSFEHRNGCSSTGVLHVPVGRPVKLIMTSQDVLHSLYIPAFRVKQDVVPGRITTLWFEATAAGEYDLFCTEYCGREHSSMIARVKVYEEEEFQAAVAECANWIDDYSDERLHEAGARLYTSRCSQCHTLDGSIKIGPSFRETHEHIVNNEEREFTNADNRVVDEQYIWDSIVNPGGEVIAGFPNAMPPFQGQLKPREIQAMISFIKRLDEFDNEGNLIDQGGE